MQIGSLCVSSQHIYKKQVNNFGRYCNVNVDKAITIGIVELILEGNTLTYRIPPKENSTICEWSGYLV